MEDGNYNKLKCLRDLQLLARMKLRLDLQSRILIAGSFAVASFQMPSFSSSFSPVLSFALIHVFYYVSSFSSLFYSFLLFLCLFTPVCCGYLFYYFCSLYTAFILFLVPLYLYVYCYFLLLSFVVFFLAFFVDSLSRWVRFLFYLLSVILWHTGGDMGFENVHLLCWCLWLESEFWAVAFYFGYGYLQLWFFIFRLKTLQILPCFSPLVHIFFCIFVMEGIVNSAGRRNLNQHSSTILKTVMLDSELHVLRNQSLFSRGALNLRDILHGTCSVLFP
jgi:hypothetical protein